MRVLVVGSGAIGLRTAVELVRRKIPVTLRSPVSPLHPSVCSVGAGGLWMPYHCDDTRTDRWALETLDELWGLAQNNIRHNQKQLVEILSAVVLHANNDHVTSETSDTQVTYVENSKLPPWTTDPRLKFQQLTVEMLSWQNTVMKLKLPTQTELERAGYMHAWLFQTPIVDSPVMLQSMLEEVDADSDSNVNVETGEHYESLEHIQEVALELNCDTVINCCGLGNQKLVNDKSMKGGRGVLLQFDRATAKGRSPLAEMTHDAVILTDAPPWGSETEPCYLIPRGDIVAVGGSYLEDDLRPNMHESERKRLLENAHLLGLDVSQCQPVGEWTGFRPYRPVTRCEEDTFSNENSKVRVIHNYGHGGSGWTVNVGCAKEVASILLNKY